MKTLDVCSSIQTLTSSTVTIFTCRLLKSSNADVDSFTMQFHSKRVRLSQPPRDHFTASGYDGKGLWPNVNSWRTESENRLQYAPNHWMDDWCRQEPILFLLILPIIVGYHHKTNYKINASLWMLLLHNIKPSHIHNTLRCCVFWAIIYIKEQLGTFSTFSFLTASSIFSFFLMTYLPSVINYRLGRGVLKHISGYFKSKNAEEVFDLIRRQAGVSLGPAECHRPWHNISHLSPEEMNTAPSSSFFFFFELRWKEEKWNRTINRRLLWTEGQTHGFHIKNGFISAVRGSDHLYWSPVATGNGRWKARRS